MSPVSPKPVTPTPAPPIPRRAARLAALATILICPPPRAAALDPATALADYARQSWMMENGLPQNSVHAILQSRDGYIWLGTEAGLVRFNGSGFVVFDQRSRPALPSGDIRCLLEGGDGTLWVGTAEGLVRWRDGKIRTFTTRDGLPADAIAGLEERGGGIVAVTGGGEAAVDGDRVEPLSDGRPGAPGSGPGSGFGPGSSLGSGSGSGFGPGPRLTARLPDGREVEATNTAVELSAPRGERPGPPPWAGEAPRSERWHAGRELPGTRIQAMLVDREGALWIGTNGGLVRHTRAGLERLPVTDPLAGASILSFLEDREGNLWVGTETDGLNVLRNQRFHTIGAREGLSSDAATAVVEDARGELWVGTGGGGLNVITPEADVPGGGGAARVRIRAVTGLLSQVILSLAAAPNGDLWIGTPDGLNRMRGNRIDAFTSADRLPDDFIRSLLVDPDGSLWVGTRRGLARMILDGGARGRGSSPARVVTYTSADGLGSDLVGAMARQADGSLWVATLAGLSRLRNGRITNYTRQNGLSGDVVTSILPGEGGTLAIGTADHGWSRWDGGSFSAAGGDGLARTGIHAILRDDLGHLWFATGEGIARCEESGSGCGHTMEFGPADGLRSRETAQNSHPSAWRSRDGRLWFATPRGLVVVAPRHFPVNTVPPPVVVERFAVDDVELARPPAGSRLKVAAGHRHFQFEYAGLSFVAPQRVRYRYMLEGFDHAWTEAGARRVAYYTNVPPGRYTFRVQAANNDGLWNREGAAFDFELRPYFRQTVWFYLLLALALAGAVLLALRRRLVAAEREFRAVLGERNRIAREIHDTLAQGYVGVSIQLEVLAELLRLNKIDAAARQLDKARSHVREGLAEARQSIWALRSEEGGEATLPVRLRRATERAGGNGTRASFGVYGAYRPMPRETERELLRVAEEAIHNVKKHAAARNLSVRLDYAPAGIALEIRDDGRGFTPDGGGGARPGHFGLTGMRERAEAIGGVLEITSEPGAGTTVRLRTPAPGEAGGS